MWAAIDQIWAVIDQTSIMITSVAVFGPLWPAFDQNWASGSIASIGKQAPRVTGGIQEFRGSDGLACI